MVIGAPELCSSLTLLASDEDFAEVVAGEKELGGGEVLEDLFDHPVVEVLGGATAVFFSEKKAIAALDLKGEHRHFLDAFVGVEDGEEGGAGAGDGEDLLENGFEEFWAEVLERIPEEYRVELAFFVVEGVCDEDVDAVGFELTVEVAGTVTEGEFEGAVERVRTGNVILLEMELGRGGGSAEIENFEAVLAVEGEKKLL